MKLTVFHKKAKTNGECRVYVQLTHKRKVTWIKTSIFVKPEYFENGRINQKKNVNARLKNLSLSETISGYEKKILILGDKQEYMSHLILFAILLLLR